MIAHETHKRTRKNTEENHAVGNPVTIEFNWFNSIDLGNTFKVTLEGLGG